MTEQTHDNPWSECPPGEVAGLVGRLQVRRRREHLRQAAVGVSCLAMLLLAGVYAVPHFQLAEPSYGGIVCSEVKSLADEYIAGRLDGGTAARIEAHLDGCQHCQEFIDTLRSRHAPAVNARAASQLPEQPWSAATTLIARVERR